MIFGKHFMTGHATYIANSVSMYCGKLPLTIGVALAECDAKSGEPQQRVPKVPDKKEQGRNRERESELHHVRALDAPRFRPFLLQSLLPHARWDPTRWRASELCISNDP